MTRTRAFKIGSVSTTNAAGLILPLAGFQEGNER